MELNVKELLNKMKHTAVQVGDKAAKAGKEFVANTKTNIHIMELNSQIDAEYKNAGKLLYAVHNGEEVDPEAIDVVLSVIDGKKAELDELNNELAKAKAATTCPVCGKNVGKNAAYCSACGAKIEREVSEKIVEVVEEAAEVVSCCEENDGCCCCAEEQSESACCEEEKCCCENAEEKTEE